MSDEDYLLHLKIFIKHGNASSSFSLRTLLESRSDLTKLHANELFHLACESNLTEVVKMLVTEFNANFNSIIDGKPALIKTPGQYLETLFKLGANPQIQVNGFFFYELNSNLRKDAIYCLDEDALSKLIGSGMDFFKPARQTGRSFIDSLGKNAIFRFRFDGIYVTVNASKVKAEFFSFLRQKGQEDYFALLDDERNTVLHLLAPNNLEPYLDKLMIIFNSVPTKDWKRVRNRARKTPYDLITENRYFYKFAECFTTKDEICAYLDDCKDLHGPDIYKKIGGKMLLSAFKNNNLELIKHLIVEDGVSIDRIVGDISIIGKADSWNSLTEENIMFLLSCTDKVLSLELFAVALIKGYQRILDKILSNDPDWSLLLTFVAENAGRLSRNLTLEQFINKAESEIGLNILAQNYFTCAKVMKWPHMLYHVELMHAV